MTRSNITIRPLQPSDDIVAITDLLHLAYLPLAKMGLRYHATWQDAQTTRHRLQSGFPYVAECDGVIVGTVTIYGPARNSAVEWYRRKDVFHFGQFAVHPDFQQSGIGTDLMHYIFQKASDLGGRHLALDTAETAKHLCDWYSKLGFVVVDRVSWDITNYVSVIMSKPLTQT